MLNNQIQNELLMATLFMVGVFIFAALVKIFLRKHARRLVGKTKTQIDDAVLGIVTGPAYTFIIFIGSYFTLKSLSFLNPYFTWLDNIAYVGSLLIITSVISRIANFLIVQWLKVKEKFKETPRLIRRIINIIIYAIAFLMILDHLNVEITPLIATLGVGGLAVGFALQSTLSNFFAGLHIVVDQPVNVGDFIELENGLSGYVKDIGWRSIKIQTLSSAMVIIPNSRLAESIVINNSLPEQEMSVIIKCGVSYESDLKKVERVTIEVAKEIQRKVAGVVKGAEPFIRYNEFGDSNINFSVIFRAEKITDKYMITHEFIKALKERYDQEKIDISWPIRKIYQG